MFTIILCTRISEFGLAKKITEDYIKWLGMDLTFQTTRIIAYLAHHKRQGITQLEAMQELGILRLSERVRECQARGWDYDKRMVEVPNRFGQTCRVMRYWLKP